MYKHLDTGLRQRKPHSTKSTKYQKKSTFLNRVEQIQKTPKKNCSDLFANTTQNDSTCKFFMSTPSATPVDDITPTLLKRQWAGICWETRGQLKNMRLPGDSSPFSSNIPHIPALIKKNDKYSGLKTLKKADKCFGFNLGLQFYIIVACSLFWCAILRTDRSILEQRIFLTKAAYWVLLVVFNLVVSSLIRKLYVIIKFYLVKILYLLINLLYWIEFIIEQALYIMSIITPILLVAFILID